MHTIEQLKNSLKIAATDLNSSGCLWIVAASSSLMIHGLDVLPSDLDFIIDPKDYERAVKALERFKTADTIPHKDTLRTAFLIEGIECEIFAYSLSAEELVKIELDDIPIPVNTLEREYGFYKMRTDKNSQERVKLIEEKLGIST